MKSKHLHESHSHEAFEPPETLQLKAVERPAPKNQPVLVKVRAASINALDWQRFTMPPFLLPLLTGGWLKPNNTLLSTDVAGRVEAVGETVTRFQPGDDVFGFAHGSWAEYALACEAYLTFKPGNRSFEEAVAVPSAAQEGFKPGNKFSFKARRPELGWLPFKWQNPSVRTGLRSVALGI